MDDAGDRSGLWGRAVFRWQLAQNLDPPHTCHSLSRQYPMREGDFSAPSVRTAGIGPMFISL